MKYLLLIGDGMGDRPMAELDGRTVLEAADTPNMDRLATQGVLGLTQTIPLEKEPGSDTANMSLMGYDPAVYHTGRSPIEAAAMGVDLGADEVAYRCNLVTLDRSNSSIVMVDYSAGHVATEPAAKLIQLLEGKLGNDILRFYPGVSYRHLLVWKNGPLDVPTIPPHDRPNQPVDDVMSLGGDMEQVNQLVRKSWPILEETPYNQKRRADGLAEANSIWLWGQGTKPKLPTYQQRFGIGGVVITAVDLIKGLGVLAGLEVVEVEGATGDLHTNYEGKVEATLDGLARSDFAVLHVEAPDEAGHSGVMADKIKAIEDFDAKVVGPMLQGMAGLGAHRVLLAPDHYTPLAARTHTREPVPYVIWDSGRPVSGGEAFNEQAAKQTGNFEPHAHNLIEALIKG